MSKEFSIWEEEYSSPGISPQKFRGDSAVSNAAALFFLCWCRGGRSNGCSGGGDFFYDMLICLR